ncbi:hypothetical protein [Fuerstiella marisgermanici]|uniref:Putative PEP-CTERM system TPR-repeat lipoprotein n=1 Tax=Fuerstiella marisgermanici TaxID=1891926 RepID=A0A1P8WF49_9PLAN|nr:hypothetical protein [Fuerstiella marisgermanici]APZ92704.1 putative PEP-CTERM system TPR-repeat lipoprotein [Fuerstiella marisgermanici]
MRSCVVLSLLFGCHKSYDVPPIPVPDLSETYQEVQEYLESKRRELESMPSSADAWGVYAMALDAHEYHPEAIICYRVATELQPAEARWKYLLANRLTATSPEEADKLLSDLTSSANATLAALVTHADVLSELDRVSESDGLLVRAEAAHPRHPAVIWRQAQHAFEAGEFEAAREKLDAIEGNYRETERLKARLRHFGGKTDAPLPDSTSAAEQLPSADQSIVDSDIAAVLRHRRDPLWRGKQAAEQAAAGDPLGLMSLAALVKKHPELTGNRLQLAFLMAGSGAHEQAEQIVREGLELFPDQEQLLVGLAALATMNSEWELAEKRLRKLISVAPEHAAGWSDLAFVLEQRLQLHEALAAYDKAILLSPGDAELGVRRGAVQALIEKGRLPKKPSSSSPN